MKFFIIIAIVLSSLNSWSQNDYKIFSDDCVEAFYSKDTIEPLSIFESPNGKKSIELQILTEKYCWYKLAISESKNGWLKIENIVVLPGCEENTLNGNFEKYKGQWVLAKNILIDVGGTGEVVIKNSDNNNNEEISLNSLNGLKFYEKSSIDSKVVCVINGFIETELIAVDRTWAQLKFQNDGKEYIGWLERKYQCAYPWTTCSFEE